MLTTWTPFVTAHHNRINLMMIDYLEPVKYNAPLGKKICGIQTHTVHSPTQLHLWYIK